MDNAQSHTKDKHHHRTQTDPPTEAELEQAQARLKTTKTTKAFGNNVRAPTIQALCHELGISVADPSKPGKSHTKMTLVNLIGKWVGIFLLCIGYTD